MGRKTAYVLVSILIVVTVLPGVTINAVISKSGAIDLFTQKKPFDGRGLHVPSDAFHPGEIVILYASVNYDGEPLAGVLVSFMVESPANGEPQGFSRVSETNASGIAEIRFTIPSVDVESSPFGDWIAHGSVKVSDTIYEDTLAFKVDWIVKLTSLRTIDENITGRTIFGIGGDVGVEVTMQSVSMTPRRATLGIVVQDALDVPVAYLELRDIYVPPNGTLVRIYCSLKLPLWAKVGLAKVSAVALTALPHEGGIPYCPELQTNIRIAPGDPFEISFHDVAIMEIQPAQRTIAPGEPVNITLLVRNEGTEAESFTINVFWENTQLANLTIDSLAPYAEKELNLTWDTSNVPEGDHILSASIPTLPGEAEEDDNTLIDGTIRIQSGRHDVAIIAITPSPSLVEAGSPINISVKVKNEGDYFETFNVSTYFNTTNLIQTLTLTSLPPGDEETLQFVWDTSVVAPGVYRLRGFAHTVPGEVEFSDNYLVDGLVTVLEAGVEVVHDVAVLSVTGVPVVVHVGEEVVVEVVVRNKGTVVETFVVRAYFDDSLIGSSVVVSLAPGSDFGVQFVWDTSVVAPGVYRLRGFAHTVPGEVEFSDNYLVDGLVTVLEAGVEVVHDVAVLSVTGVPVVVHVGEEVVVEVVVRNKGTVVETFVVRAYFDDSLIGSSVVVSLAPGSDFGVQFVWNTSDVTPGNYTIWAWASPVQNETNVDDNKFIAYSTIIKYPQIIPNWLIIILIVVVPSTTVFFVAWLITRSRRRDGKIHLKRARGAWYYRAHVKQKPSHTARGAWYYRAYIYRNKHLRRAW